MNEKTNQFLSEFCQTESPFKEKHDIDISLIYF